MIDTLKQIAINAMEGESPVQLTEAQIMTAPPNISIKLRGNSKLVIPKELIIVADRLVSTHSHPGTSPHTNKLMAGNKVMVAVLQGGQSFFIIDKIVTY